MEKEKMLVTQGLNELKLLDNRIVREIQKASFITAAKTKDTKVTSNITKMEYADNAKATYQSVNDLINRRKRIKAAIVDSNARTMVTIHGIEMTVAEAIEMKTSIEYEEGLLKTLKNQNENAKSTVARQNILMEEKIDKYLETMMGREAKTKKEDYSEMIDPIREANEYSLVDPLGVEKIITELSDKIDGFRSEVDSKLQISNCITWIEF